MTKTKESFKAAMLSWLWQSPLSLTSSPCFRLHLFSFNPNEQFILEVNVSITGVVTSNHCSFDACNPVFSFLNALCCLSTTGIQACPRGVVTTSTMSCWCYISFSFNVTLGYQPGLKIPYFYHTLYFNDSFKWEQIFDALNGSILKCFPKCMAD